MNRDYKYHIVYKTTNKVNNKIYVGLHSTNNIDDGYLGSGWVLKDAKKKYGKHMFSREALYVFDTRDKARAMEAGSIEELSKTISIARGNIRNLIKKNIRGKLGWTVTLVEDIV